MMSACVPTTRMAVLDRCDDDAKAKDLRDVAQVVARILRQLGGRNDSDEVDDALEIRRAVGGERSAEMLSRDLELVRERRGADRDVRRATRRSARRRAAAARRVRARAAARRAHWQSASRSSAARRCLAPPRRRRHRPTRRRTRSSRTARARVPPPREAPPSQRTARSETPAPAPRLARFLPARCRRRRSRRRRDSPERRARNPRASS